MSRSIIWPKLPSSCCHPTKPTNAIFACLIAVLDSLHAGGNVWAAVTYFALWAVRLAGLLPDLRVSADSRAIIEEMLVTPIQQLTARPWAKETARRPAPRPEPPDRRTRGAQAANHRDSGGFMSDAPLTFQETVLRLKKYWSDRGCIIQEPYDVEVGAGTMAPETFLRVLGPHPYSVAYVQPSRRPADGRYGENPNRLYKHQQLQVILKPSPADVIDLYLGSLQAIGIDLAKHDIKFEEDNWEAPTLGAWGIGWQVMLDGLEISQFTYFQQCGGFDLDLVPAELTYGLERIVAFLQNVDSVYDIEWAPGVPYRRRSPQG